MAQVPKNRRLLAEDFPKEQQSWISRLLSPLNDFNTSTSFALQNGLTVKENLAAEYKELDFTVPATGSAFPIVFRCSQNSKVVGCWTADANEVSGSPSPLTAAVYTTWSWNDGVMTISNITGLTAGKRYKVKLYVSYG